MNCRWFAVAILVLSGCAADPGAVTGFSALAPDPVQLHNLTIAYADAPDKLKALDVLNLTSMSAMDAANDVKARNEQVAEIDALHGVLVDYMKSLGALANNNLVQTSADTRKVTEGLAALSSANHNLGLTPQMIAGVGDIMTLLGDAATGGYRQEQLTRVIEGSETPFQKLINTEKTIISEGVIKELQNVRDKTTTLAEVTHALQVNDAAVANNSRTGLTGVTGLNPKLQGSGAADIAALYLLQKDIGSELASLDLQIKAAEAYLRVLDKISAAHSILYNNSDNLLSKQGARTAIAQLAPLLKDANTALNALKNL
jgi:hypothetical protein